MSDSRRDRPGHGFERITASGRAGQHNGDGDHYADERKHAMLISSVNLHSPIGVILAVALAIVVVLAITLPLVLKEMDKQSSEWVSGLFIIFSAITNT